MEAKFADALEKIFPSSDGKWSNFNKTVSHFVACEDGRNLKFSLILSIENYHIAITCSRPDKKVSARHRLIFNPKNSKENSEFIMERIKKIIDLELGSDFLNSSRYVK
jgi:hypothetical protein